MFSNSGRSLFCHTMLSITILKKTPKEPPARRLLKIATWRGLMVVGVVSFCFIVGCSPFVDFGDSGRPCGPGGECNPGFTCRGISGPDYVSGECIPLGSVGPGDLAPQAINATPHTSVSIKSPL
ncbi:MAG: hypothetical protein R3C68_18845 [Myxococcota bacterium]